MPIKARLKRNERKRAGLKRKTPSVRLKSVVAPQEAMDSVSAHISVIDQKGVIIAVNKAWTDFSKANSNSPRKLPANTKVGTNYLHVLRNCKGKNSAEAMPAHNGIQDVLAGKSKIYSLEYRCDGKNERRWFKMVVLPLPKKRGAVITHHDITYAKLLEEKQVYYAAELEKKVNSRTRQLQKALSKKYELVKMKDKFITTTSHEFRTPLAVISLALSIIRKQHRNSDSLALNDKLDQIQKQVDRMNFLLEDLFFLEDQNMKGSK